MRAIDAMFVWTPFREPFDDSKIFPLKGKLAVTTFSERDRIWQHPESFGACNLDWKETDDAGRLQMAQRLITVLIHENSISDTEVRNALAQVDEFARFPFHY
jgi:hypothetical protein